MPSYSKPCMQLGGAAQDDLGGLQPPKAPPRSAPDNPRMHAPRVNCVCRAQKVKIHGYLVQFHLLDSTNSLDMAS